MNTIDTSKWAEFRIDQWFTLVKGSRLTSLARRNGNIPYVGASQFNNGITHFIGNDEKLHPGGVLTVCYNGPVGTTFYQPQEFWATDDVNVLYPKVPMSMESMLFIAPMIENAGSEYAYIDKWKMTDMAAAIIRLPITPIGTPDWKFMEQTMRKVLDQQERELDTLRELSNWTSQEIATNSWGKFQVGKLFDVVNGRKYPMTWRVPGSIPLISTSGLNNGVTAEVGFPNGSDYVTHSNLITVAYSGNVGATFYHEGDVFIGETAMGLLPRAGVPLNLKTGLFLSAVIYSAVKDFTYERKLKVSEMRDQIAICLPVTPTGDPDWAYMEQTMRRLLKERETAISSLQTILSEVA